jgi:hypothetical protein
VYIVLILLLIWLSNSLIPSILGSYIQSGEENGSLFCSNIGFKNISLTLINCTNIKAVQDSKSPIVILGKIKIANAPIVEYKHLSSLQECYY